MKSLITCTLFLLLIAGISGCTPEEPWVQYGEDFTMENPLTLSQVVENVDEYMGEKVFVEGMVNRTCQNKGGSMILEDGNAKIRVRFGDHDFYLPYESKGKQARVEGVISQITISEAVARNWAERFEYPVNDPDEIEGEQEVLILTAIGASVKGGTGFSPEQQALIDEAEKEEQ